MHTDKAPPAVRRRVKTMLRAYKKDLFQAWTDQNVKGYEDIAALIVEDCTNIWMGPRAEFLLWLREKQVPVLMDPECTSSCDHMWLMYKTRDGWRGWVLIDRTQEMN